MCLVCIAFASWVLRSSDPDAADAWKAGMESFVFTLLLRASQQESQMMLHCLTDERPFSSAGQRQRALSDSVPAAIRAEETGPERSLMHLHKHLQTLFFFFFNLGPAHWWSCECAFF